MKVYELQTNSEEYSVFYEISKTGNNNPADNFVHNYWTKEWESINEDDYKPIVLKIYKADNGKKNYQTDIGIILRKLVILSEKAIEVLLPILQQSGQFLPVETESKRKKFIGFYPSKNVKPISYVNLELSDWNQAQYGKMFRKITLNNINLENEYIFCISEVNIGVFVTEKFKELVEKNDLKGFYFNREVKINYD